MTNPRIYRYNQRVFASLLIVYFCLGMFLFVLVRHSVANFRHEEIKKNMIWMGNSVNYLCSSGYDQLARVGEIQNKVYVLLKQTETLEMIEDFVRSNDFFIIIYDCSDKTPITLTSSLAGAEDRIDPLNLKLNTIGHLNINNLHYSSYAISFDSWSWKIVLLKDSTSYDTLLSRLNIFYLVIAFLVCTLIIGFFLFYRQQTRSEQALRQSEMNLKSTLYSLAEGVVTVDSNGCVTQMNPAAMSITGWNSLEEALNRPASEILPLLNPDDQSPLSDDAFKNRRGVPLTNKAVGEFILVAKDGEQKLVQIRTAQLQISTASRKDESLVLSIHDITEQRIVEKQLRLAQKMEAIGMMAGSVAHDLNNILSGIISYPELLLLRLPPDSAMRSPLEAIQKSGRRAATVVADLLTIARGVVSERITADLNILIKEFFNSPEFMKVKEEYPDIELSVDLTDNLLYTNCSTVHVKKCIMNLLLNSAEAISGKGKCRLSTENCSIDSSRSTELNIKPGNYVVLKIQDDGPGIKEEHIGHIFEPFYTKKKMGSSGTGLGLAIVWNTMQDHNGAVTVESQDRGVTFTLYFPATSELKPLIQKKLTLDEFRGNGETILIVDDDPQQRDIATQILSLINYQVESVSSGEAAIDYLARKRPDLILLDMIMDPGKNGYETFREIIKINPHQKALIASGFSESEEAKKTLQLGAGGFISKPYSMEQLGKAVKEILTRPDGVHQA